MKLSIEIDQATENSNPTVVVKVDDKPIGVIEGLEFVLKSDSPKPKCSVRLPNLNKVLGPHASPEVRSAMAPLIQSIGLTRKALSFFKWINLP